MTTLSEYVAKTPTITAMQYDGTNGQDFVDWLGDDYFNEEHGGVHLTGSTGMEFGSDAAAFSDPVNVTDWVYIDLRYSTIPKVLADSFFQVTWEPA